MGGESLQSHLCKAQLVRGSSRQFTGCLAEWPAAFWGGVFLPLLPFLRADPFVALKQKRGSCQVSKELVDHLQRLGLFAAPLPVNKARPLPLDTSGSVEPWNLAHCARALRTQRHYVAGGAVTWLALGGRPQDQLPVADFCFADIERQKEAMRPQPGKSLASRLLFGARTFPGNCSYGSKLPNVALKPVQHAGWLEPAFRSLWRRTHGQC